MSVTLECYPSCIRDLMLTTICSLNMINMPTPENADQLQVDEIEKRALPNGEEFFNSGMAYALEHGTRTATIGHALSSSPLAVLSWYVEYLTPLIPLGCVAHT